MVGVPFIGREPVWPIKQGQRSACQFTVNSYLKGLRPGSAWLRPVSLPLYSIKLNAVANEDRGSRWFDFRKVKSLHRPTPPPTVGPPLATQKCVWHHIVMDALSELMRRASLQHERRIEQG